MKSMFTGGGKQRCFSVDIDAGLYAFSRFKKGFARAFAKKNRYI